MKYEDIKVKKEFYDFLEMCEIINKKLGFNQRGCGKFFHPETIDFGEWCDSKGYGEIDSEGRKRGVSQLWFAEWKQDVSNGLYKDVPYLDFWHWQLDNAVNRDFRNDSFGYVNISLELTKDAEDWQKYIQKVWYETFKEIADEDGYIDIWISW
jgi:hypothetical protein